MKGEILGLVKEEEVVDLASELVRIPSFTTQETPAAMFMRDYFEDLGFEVEVQEVQPGRRQVVARLRGRGGGRSMMFNGHLDIDPLTESWRWDPFQPRREGNRLWGAGVHNMKSGVAAMSVAAKAVKNSGIELEGDLIVACVVGELQGGVGTIHLVKSGVLADMAIVPEPYSVENILTKCVGVHQFAINTIGKSEHISRMEESIDALQKMIKVMERLKGLKFDVSDPDLPGAPRWVVGSIIGGRGRDHDLAGPYNIPDFCTIIVDFRYPPGLTPEMINSKVVGLLEDIRREDPEFRYEFEYPVNPKFRVAANPMPPMNVSPDAEVVQLLKESHREVTGSYPKRVGVVPPYSYCGNDTAHLALAGIECCLYGPRGYPDEVEKHVRVDEMLICARSLALTAAKVCTMKKAS
ncbi:MAG: M20 family metallopeptidase [Candidatus Bathyarchaeia archaeon]|nr:M20 family metallopeptidase [Candidatus Bathyarchaeota archaeon]